MWRLINKRQTGFVLMWVLILISIFSLLSISLLNLSFLSQKINNQQFKKIYYLEKAKQIMAKAEIHFPLCQLNTPLSVADQSFEWWKKWGCFGKTKNLNYYLVIESLGQNVCAYLNADFKSVASYYRITGFFWISTPYELQNELQIILQSIVVKKSLAVSACRKQPHRVSLGRQNLRQVYAS